MGLDGVVGPEEMAARVRFGGAVFLLLSVLLLSCSLLAQGEQKQEPGPGATNSDKSPKAEKPEVYSNEKEACPGRRERTGEATFEEYSVRTYRWPNAFGCFEILRGGKRVFRMIGFDFQIGGTPELPLVDKSELLTPIGTDVTGAGKPNLVVGEWTGGMHCCFIFYVFDLGGKGPTLIGKIDAEDSGLASFQDAGHDGRIEFAGSDWNFENWHASSAESPAPDILLRFRDGKFRLALDMMQKSPPPLDQLSAGAVKVKDEFDGANPNPPPDLWDEMLKLIYSGNAKLAWKFLELAWPAERPGRNRFRKEFRKQLTKSMYWEDLGDLNGGSI
jgi:hypothetical protein